MTPAERIAKRKKPSSRAAWGTLKFVGTWRCTLRECRLSLGLTLADVSRVVGLSIAGLQRIEVGIDPVLTNARKLATFYGKTVEELWPELAGGNRNKRIRTDREGEVSGPGGRLDVGGPATGRRPGPPA